MPLTGPIHVGILEFSHEPGRVPRAEFDCIPQRTMTNPEPRTFLPFALLLTSLAACNGSSDPGGGQGPPVGEITPLSLVVFSALNNLDGTRELWASVVIDSGPFGLARLHEPLQAGDRVDEYGCSDAGDRVAYRTVELNGTTETGRLWTISALEVVDILNDPTASLDASLHEIGGPLAPGQSILDFQLAPDGTRIVYRMQDTLDRGLYMVDLTGPEPGAPTDLRIGPSSSITTDVGSWSLSPDGARVAWVTDGPTSSDLVLRDLAGSATDPVQVNPVSGPGRPVMDFEFGPDSLSLAYGQRENNRLRAWFADVPIDSVAVVQPVMPPSPDRHEISPTGSHLTLRVRRLVAAGEGHYENRESLAVADVSGPQPGSWESLTGLLPTDSHISWIAWAADSSYVLYLADSTNVEHPELYWVGSPTSSPTAPVTVNVQLPPGATVGVRVKPTLAGPYVLYRADQYTTGEIVLMQALVEAVLPGVPFQLTPQLPRDGGARGPVVAAPDGASALYVADLETAGQMELYSVPVAPDPVAPVPLDLGAGGVPHTKLSPLLQPGGRVFGTPVFDTTGQHVLFRADVDGDGAGELYLVRIDSAGVPSPAQLISGGIPAGFTVWNDYSIAP